MDVKECVLSVSPLPTNDEISLDIDGQDVKDVQLNEQFGGGDDFAPKVRKPYTITKQRERWTEEEHKKFLEALKLYGRAWRRIEEHVGSKTAVQIRSHAQKFFSKVSRESNVGDGGSVKPVEIPPPRPKRKPMHPYPRKLVSPVKTGILIPERSVSPNLSPTSVLSVVGSDQSGGADSCVPNGSPSPVSSPAPAPARSSTHIFGSEAPKLLSEDVISSSQSDHEDENSSIDEEIPLDLDLSPRKTFVNEAATQSLKLFGKTLLVVDSSSSSCKTESFDKNKRVETCSYPLRVVPLKAASNSACEDAWRSLVEVQSSEMKNDLWYIQFTGDMMNSSSAAALPWLTLASHSTRDVHNPTPIRAQSNEGSSSDSNTDSVGAATDGRGREEMSSFSSYKLSKRIAANCRRGFVPYKRCFTEQDSSAETVQEREKQRIRLCL